MRSKTKTRNELALPLDMFCFAQKYWSVVEEFDSYSYNVMLQNKLISYINQRCYRRAKLLMMKLLMMMNVIVK